MSGLRERLGIVDPGCKEEPVLRFGITATNKAKIHAAKVVLEEIIADCEARANKVTRTEAREFWQWTAGYIRQNWLPKVEALDA